jgi:hypothetical protein
MLIAGWRIPMTAGNKRLSWSWNRTIYEHPILYTVRSVYVRNVFG